MSKRVAAIGSMLVLAALVAALVAWYLAEPPAATLAKAQAAVTAGRPRDAAPLLERIQPTAPEFPAAQRLLGDVRLHQRRLTQAETAYQAVLAADSADAVAHSRLAFLFGVTGRRLESLPHLRALVRSGHATPTELAQLLDAEEPISNEPFYAEVEAADPQEVLSRLGRAAASLARAEVAEAVRAAEAVLERRPAEPAALALLGEAHLRRGDATALAQWSASLPAAARADARVQAVVGRALMTLGRPEPAAQALGESLRQYPEYRTVLTALATALRALGRSADADRCGQRAVLLQRLAVLGARYRRDPSQAPVIAEIATTLRAAGRLPEALRWAGLGLQAGRPTPELARLHADLAILVQPTTPWLLADHDLSRALDLSALRPPTAADWRGSELPRPTAGTTAAEMGELRFVDVARAAGITFTYFNSPDPATAGGRLFEFTGGGVAVIDYDHDHWPDLYFTQGCRWPPDGNDAEHRDRLYRNNRDGTFTEVTAAAGLGDSAYSQGVAVGDLNNDGWPDLFVGNIGRNRLYLNQGDGTFREVADAFAGADERWTTSVAIADLNGDGWADLYEVNYLAGGRETFEAICSTAIGPRTCDPRGFAAAADRVWVNQGDGRFVDATAKMGMTAPNGKGLGVLIADLTGDGRLDVFVANDTEANFAYVQVPAATGPTFVEQAIPLGIGLGRTGRAEACMGIAAADLDQDGRLDLHVTNFHNEPNNLLLQTGDGLFVDRAEPNGVAGPSRPVLGFGTQALDADNDGQVDLVVANGDIDDFTAAGRSYRQPPHLYRNQGGGRFRLQSAERAGSYFQGSYLGRGLAVLDYDRDGRLDLVVSHLEAPAALVRNQTEPVGHYLRLDLQATSTARDAIGTRVTVEAGGQRWTACKSAGHGYLASNEPIVHLGVGQAARLERVEIAWPGGKTDLHQNVEADREWRAVEGQPLTPLPR